jgi:hypothetical protein
MEPKGYAILGGAADIHATDDDALVYASRNGHLAVVECLISHGAEGLRHSWRCSGYSCR